MAEVCVSRNLSITGGELGIEKWSIVRHVADQTFPSVGDGAFSALTTLPGKLMVDATVAWTSDSPLDTMILLRVQRDRRDWIISNPNAVQIRDRWTFTLDGTTPAVPLTSTLLQSQVGGAMDYSTNTTGTPMQGRYWQYLDPQLTEDWIGPVEPGGTIRLRYRAYLWTPPPFSNNANNNTPVHEAYIRNTRIQLLAFPTQDTAVING